MFPIHVKLTRWPMLQPWLAENLVEGQDYHVEPSGVEGWQYVVFAAQENFDRFAAYGASLPYVAD